MLSPPTYNTTHQVPGDPVEQEGEDLLCEVPARVSPVLTAVDEGVLAARVAVEVAVHGHAGLLHQPSGTEDTVGVRLLLDGVNTALEMRKGQV